VKRVKARTACLVTTYAQRPVRDHGRVVDENFDLSKPLMGGVHQTPYVSLVPDISQCRHHVGAARGDCSTHAFEPLLINIVDDDTIACLHK
jgi:hypothetical protein